MPSFMGRIVDRKFKKIINLSKRIMKGSRGAAYTMLIVSATFIAMFWSSLFLYTTFYVTYLPKDSHVWQVPLQFEPCDDDTKICSFPSSFLSVQDSERGSAFARNQQYQVFLDLELPESPTNEKHGMFMVKIQFRTGTSKAGGQQSIIETEQQSTMLRYKSPLLRLLQTLFMSPFMVFGSHEEKQWLALEFFNDFEDNVNNPVSHALIEIRSRQIEIYSARLRIHAKFSGVRYLMYHYPVGTAVFGIAVSMNFLSAMIIFSWYQFSPKKNEKKGQVKMVENRRKLNQIEEEKTEENVKLTIPKLIESSSSETKIELKALNIALDGAVGARNRDVSSETTADIIESLTHEVDAKPNVENLPIEGSRKCDDDGHSRSSSGSIECIAEDSSPEREVSSSEKSHTQDSGLFSASHSSMETSEMLTKDYDVLPEACTVRRRDNI